jgi:hypothetical protein
MVEIDKKKLEKILYEIGPSLGIIDIPYYLNKIIKKAESSQPNLIRTDKHYVAVIHHIYPIAEFVDGKIRCIYDRKKDDGLYYRWERKLREDELYVIGRMGYATIGKGE